MALAYPTSSRALHHLPDNDCHVDRTNSDVGVGGLRVAFDHSSQSLRHVLLMLLHPNDVCCRLGIRQILDQFRAPGSHHTTILRRHLQNADDPHWLLLADPVGDNLASVCCPVHN